MKAFRISLIALILLASCARPEAVEEAAPRAGGQYVIAQQQAPDYKTVAAVLTSRDVGDARARIGGTLTRLLVREGDQVRRGQLVAVISDQRLALEAQAGVASVAAAEATAVRARADLRRTQVLFDEGWYAQARLDQVRAEAQAAEANLRAAQAQRGALAAADGQGRVLAPADGRVTRAPIPQGAVVMPGEVVVAIATGARVLRLELPEAHAAFLREGQEVRIVRSDDGDAPLSVRVRQVYPAIENGRVMADLDAGNLEGEFVGARVRVLIPTGERAAIIVPSRYVVTRFGVDYVRLVREGGAVIEAPVQRGAALPTDALPDGVEILSGLSAGDVIVPPGLGA